LEDAKAFKQSNKTSKMIECRNITKTYRNGSQETPVLKGLTFTIKDGDYVAIMGPSGSGKSTLMHILGMLDTPSSGQYFIDGHDVSSLSADEAADMRMRKIGFVFQAFNLLPRATVVRNVALPLVYAGVSPEERTERAKNALRAAGMDEERFEHLTNQISGGQMQRVAIARALVNDPSLILADEPTGNLDSKTGEIVMQTFDELNKRGRTIVLITHEREVAEHAHRIIHLKDGMIVNDEAAGKRKA
jgi:putative ABC transport system ATP-binding protein